MCQLVEQYVKLCYLSRGNVYGIKNLVISKGSYNFRGSVYILSIM